MDDDTISADDNTNVDTAGYTDDKTDDTEEDTDEDRMDDKMDDDTISADERTRTERRFPQRPIKPTKGSRIP